jgi:hypothetical protein
VPSSYLLQYFGLSWSSDAGDIGWFVFLNSKQMCMHDEQPSALRMNHCGNADLYECAGKTLRRASFASLSFGWDGRYLSLGYAEHVRNEQVLIHILWTQFGDN